MNFKIIPNIGKVIILSSLFFLNGCITIKHSAKDKLYYNKPSFKFSKSVKSVYFDLMDISINSASDMLIDKFKQELVAAFNKQEYEILSSADNADLTLKIKTEFYEKRLGDDTYFIFFKLGWPLTYGGKEPGLKVQIAYLSNGLKWKKIYEAYNTCGYLQKDYDGNSYSCGGSDSRIIKVVEAVIKDMALMRNVAIR